MSSHMKTTALRVIVLVGLGLVMGGLLYCRKDASCSGKDLSCQPPAAPTAFEQDGILPAYTLVSVPQGSGESTDMITTSVVISGGLSRKGINQLMRRLYVTVRNENPQALGYAVYLYADEAAVATGPSAALASYIRKGQNRPRVYFDEEHFEAAAIPDAAPELLSEEQRKTAYYMLKRSPAERAQDVEASLMATYGLSKDDLQAVREEGEQKNWGGTRPSRREESTL